MDFDLTRALRAQAAGKALGPFPALMSRDPVSTYTPGYGQQPRTDALFSQQNAERHAGAYGGDQAMDWVYDAINLYADPISTAPFHLKQQDGTKLVKTRLKGTPPDHNVGPPDLYRLLEQPNPFMMYDELVALLVIDLMLVGNAYWFKWRTGTSGKPLAIYRLAPSHVKLVPGPFGPERYEYQPPGVKDPLKISAEDMLHFRRPNPHSQYLGLGVIQGGGRAMDLDLAVTDTVASYYENRADPSMIIQAERRVSRDVFNKLRAQLRARSSGSHRAGELLVLEAGLKASSLSASASNALFDSLSKMSRDRILAKFRANPKLLGIMDETGGADKVADARLEFDNAALRPFMDKLQKLISAKLTAAWDCEYVIDYRTQMPPDQAVKVAGEIAKIPGIKVRELRRQYTQFGIEESTGDAAIDETVLNMPTNELDANGNPIGGGAGLADQPLPGEAGRPPGGNRTAAFPKNGAAPTPGARVRGPAKKSLDEIAARLEVLGLLERVEGKAVSTPAPDNRLSGEHRPSDSFAGARRIDIDDAASDIAAGLRDASVTLERALLDHVEGKALKTSDLAGRIRKSVAWTTFRNQITKIIEDGAKRAAQSAVAHSGLTLEDEVDYDSIVKSVANRPEGIRSIVNTLRTRVVNAIKDARNANAERTEFETAVRASLSDWAASQAVTIADTEATHTYNEATLTAAEQAGIKSVLVTDGDEDDEPCIEANGQVWDIKTARERRVEHPRCRRAFLPLTAEAVT
jgi:HK97 family phage portal protein